MSQRSWSIGDAVEVWSRSASVWGHGSVKRINGNMVLVEFFLPSGNGQGRTKKATKELDVDDPDLQRADAASGMKPRQLFQPQAQVLPAPSAAPSMASSVGRQEPQTAAKPCMPPQQRQEPRSFVGVSRPVSGPCPTPTSPHTPAPTMTTVSIASTLPSTIGYEAPNMTTVSIDSTRPTTVGCEAPTMTTSSVASTLPTTVAYEAGSNKNDEKTQSPNHTAVRDLTGKYRVLPQEVFLDILQEGNRGFCTAGWNFSVWGDTVSVIEHSGLSGRITGKSGSFRIMFNNGVTFTQHAEQAAAQFARMPMPPSAGSVGTTPTGVHHLEETSDEIPAILYKKLYNPGVSLSPPESIQCLMDGIEYGKRQVAAARGKALIALIGNTGAGKSSFANYLHGCTMEFVARSKILQDGHSKKLLCVNEDSKVREIMRIGHGNRSCTVAATVMAANSSCLGPQFAYCDCPGFLDNRGVEIDVSNAVSVKMAFEAAASVRTCILINYHSLMADRGRGVRELCKILISLFGSTASVCQVQDSLCAIITQAPLRDEENGEYDATAIEDLLLDKTGVPDDCVPVLDALRGRTHVYHPLDKGPSSWSNRDNLLAKITQLKPISDAASRFKAVLTADSEKELRLILNSLSQIIVDDFMNSRYEFVEAKLVNVLKMSVIDNSTVARMLSEVKNTVLAKADHYCRATDDMIMRNKFEQADNMIKTLVTPSTNALLRVPDLGEQILNELKQKLDSLLFRLDNQQKMAAAELKARQEAHQAKLEKEEQQRRAEQQLLAAEQQRRKEQQHAEEQLRVAEQQRLMHQQQMKQMEMQLEAARKEKENQEKLKQQIQPIEKIVQVPHIIPQEVVRHQPVQVPQEMVKEVPVPMVQPIERVVEVPQMMPVQREVPVPQMYFPEYQRDLGDLGYYSPGYRTTIFEQSFGGYPFPQPGQMQMQVGGNLRYPVQPQYLLKARSIIDMVHSGTKLADALGFTEAPKAAPRSSQNLVILYTDFEPDDVLAVAQILEWKAQLRELEQEPLIVFCADFKTKDGGTVFEKKQLMAALTLGITDYPILTYEGDRGLNRAFDGTIHPKAGQLAALRRSSIASICGRIADFKGERIDFYIMAPGHGNLGAIIGTLQIAGVWPLQAKWKVSMYTGSFNTRGMTDEDLKALEVIMAGSDHPLVDMSKFPFFGGKESHPVTASLGTFSCPSFGTELTAKAPLLAAAMVLFNEEFNQGLIHPENKSIFKGSDLDPGEETRFAAIKNVFYQRGVTAYAQALKHDAGLWKKVVDYKKTTVDAFATDACDSPLCDQLLFLYEWLSTSKAHWLATSVNGRWCLNTRSGYTNIDPSGRDPSAFRSINAIQPILQNPRDEAMLREIQEMLQHMVLQHVQQVQTYLANIPTSISECLSRK